ncbi:unnamed protein product [Paramecium octaurelia]|uniref:Transmembrane protein n=1 Tax=Paramecium octaurelia TaxID=43137 RepID=A0A8S1RZZ8_PAROT|nr:unnamed protein product [Paramecium octaurelia]CAD8138899.1 unnamed protein product [Paramecium octaurelia]
MQKLRNIYKNFYENVVKGGQKIDAPPKYNFKGQKQDFKDFQRGPQLTREQLAQNQKLDEELKPQSRELRLKNAFYFCIYMGWFAGVILFVMYRLGSDEIGDMERSAKERIRLRESLKKENQR